MTRITIVPVDGAVYKSDRSYSDLDFSSCGIPDEVHALQWDGSAGWIEFIDTRRNKQIGELPEWANACVAKFDEAEAARIAAEEAAAAAAAAEAEETP